MIRDMMLDCVERCFDALRAPQHVQWLADNGCAYTDAETIDFAAALTWFRASRRYAAPRATASARLS
jgi:hypothetical protein